MMTSISITREKNWVPWKCSSPLKPTTGYSGKVFPYIFLSIINATVIVVLGVFVFGMPIEGVYFYSLSSILFIITALSLGILDLNSLIQTNCDDDFLMGLMLPVIILSGFIFHFQACRCH
jgi:ABC-2 type transport system permease protein